MSAFTDMAFALGYGSASKRRGVRLSPEAEEGDGFILVLAYRDDEKRSDLLVLDAQNVEAEPLATIQVPTRIPFGFHGNWRPA